MCLKMIQLSQYFWLYLPKYQPKYLPKYLPTVLKLVGYKIKEKDVLQEHL